MNAINISFTLTGDLIFMHILFFSFFRFEAKKKYSHSGRKFPELIRNFIFVLMSILRMASHKL